MVALTSAERQKSYRDRKQAAAAALVPPDPRPELQAALLALAQDHCSAAAAPGYAAILRDEVVRSVQSALAGLGLVDCRGQSPKVLAVLEVIRRGVPIPAEEEVAGRPHRLPRPIPRPLRMEA
ncbi:hypothetical protein [Siccirubricoccus phaeus]|uniref:hypothetical protein n=1 Tax=Siccirubricoccus phaeus TaxID=2595053 RepID=UPI0011F1E729|nr:hypothetical protein [Siccirubricoccus phaeus]